MPSRSRADTAIAVILLGVAGGYAWLAHQLPERHIPGSVGLDFVPLLLAGLLAILAASLFVRGRRRGRGLAPPAGPAGEMPGWIQAGAVVGLMVLYVAATTRVGFLLATPVYLAVTMWQSGARRPGFIALHAIGLTLAVWVAFYTLFKVPLPRGPFF